MNKILLISLVCISQAFAQVKDSGWKNLFNGKDLKGWKALNGKAKFEVENGVLVGTTVAGEPNSFLATEKVYDDFILEMDFKISNTNSGVQIRSESKADYQAGRVHGYQVDFDPSPRAWTGGIYDEARRGWLYPLDYNPAAREYLKVGDWNKLRIECLGPDIVVWLNDKAVSHIRDEMTTKGFIALQVHAVSASEAGSRVWWRNIRVKTGAFQLTPTEIRTADFLAARKLSDQGKGFTVEEVSGAKRIDIAYQKKVVASYSWADSLMKPVLHPVRTLDGIEVTRRFPLERKPGERADHPHQVGWFFTHESVNGIDFWNSSQAIRPADRSRYGKIIHTRYLFGQGWENEAFLITQARWQTPTGAVLEEMTRFHFTVRERDLIIDRQTDLTAVEDVVFKDAKDALSGFRVARELELPNQWEDQFVLPDGSISARQVNNSGATGQFFNHEGITGEAIWGKQSPWLCLTGFKDNQKISIAWMDHRTNIDYPVHWHARGYGLISANPLGRSIFPGNAAPLNFQLTKGKSVKFLYRMVVREGSWLSASEVDRYAEEFTRP